MKRKAILFDVRSIQRYIYAANKLRTNIGASYIVENLFRDNLVPVLEEEFTGSKDLSSWEAPGAHSDEDYDCQIAYVGGGNAMVLFDISVDDEVLRKIVALFSQRVMINAPGLHIGAAIGLIDLTDDSTYKKSRDELFAILKQTQNNVVPNVSLPYTGFTQVCDIDGETACYYDSKGLFSGEKHSYYSHEAAAKASYVKQSNKKLEKLFEKELQGEYSFPSELEKLGQKEQKNYIAIVHIDGNNMGVKFNACKNISSYRSLSAEIKEKTKQSFKRLLNTIVAEYDEYQEHDALVGLTDKDGKKILPIRPLILGGDDVTFVCPAKVAIAYAKRFIGFMAEKTDVSSNAESGGECSGNEKDKAISIDCCGGIAILNTKYPFFRGYVLAEQLCDAAKSKMREIWDETNSDSGSSWLDFIFLHGEQAPTLKQIIENEYGAELGNMHFGPYCVEKNQAGEKIDEDHMLDKLIDCAKKLESCMQKNKVKELRAVLQKDEGTINSFMVQLNNLGQKLPDVEYRHVDTEIGWGTGINKGFTPYVDAIEIMEYMEGADKNVIN